MDTNDLNDNSYLYDLSKELRHIDDKYCMAQGEHNKQQGVNYEMERIF